MLKDRSLIFRISSNTAPAYFTFAVSGRRLGLPPVTFRNCVGGSCRRRGSCRTVDVKDTVWLAKRSPSTGAWKDSEYDPRRMTFTNRFEGSRHFAPYLGLVVSPKSL